MVGHVFLNRNRRSDFEPGEGVKELNPSNTIEIFVNKATDNQKHRPEASVSDEQPGVWQ